MSKSKNKVTHEGELNLNGLIIPCFVLEDGTRILSGRGLQEALRIRDKPEKGEKRGGYILDKFFKAKTLKSLVESKLKVANFEPIICYRGNQKMHGYEATVLVDLCDMMLDARKKRMLTTERQQIVADQCEILVRAFAKVGIIALVDEATGYQYTREKFELQAILKAFISDEIMKWQETFQLSFYKEIFRLWNIPFTPQNIKRKPMFIGTLTNKFVYENLPKGIFVLEKLKEKTPKTVGGNYRYRLHQSLTPEVGREALKKVIYSVEAIASISDNKRQFVKLINEKYGQKEIPFDDLETLDEPPQPPKEVANTTFNTTLKGMLKVPPPKKEKAAEK